jgi:hypothetical protein
VVRRLCHCPDDRLSNPLVSVEPFAHQPCERFPSRRRITKGDLVLDAICSSASSPAAGHEPLRVKLARTAIGTERGPKYSSGQATTLFVSLTFSLSLSVRNRLTEALTR